MYIPTIQPNERSDLYHKAVDTFITIGMLSFFTIAFAIVRVSVLFDRE